MSPTDPHLIAQLKDQQKACLLLALTGATSKEIGRFQQLTPFTVDQYLHAAQRLLKAGSRREAGRALFAALDLSELKRLELKYPALAQYQFSGPSLSSDATHGASGQRWRPASLLSDVPTFGGASHDLTKGDKIQHVVRTTLLTTITLTAVVLTLAGAISFLS